jgi:uncharacterized protein (TIGR03437 family)
VGTALTRAVSAPSIPLPAELAGISVALEQSLAPRGPFAVPLLAVFPVASCPNVGGACGVLTGISLQVPFELAAGPFNVGGVTQNVAKLTVSENGVAVAAVEVTPASDQIHVLRYGDSLVRPSVPGDPVAGSPLVTHADGSVVTPGNPARAGETLVIYLVGAGLGQVFDVPSPPPAATGSAPPKTVPAARVSVDFDFRPNAAPSKPLFPGSATVPVWLLAGYVGLYQANVVLPAVIPQVPACGSPGVVSNLTIDLGGLRSADGAAICVAAP